MPLHAARHDAGISELIRQSLRHDVKEHRAEFQLATRVIISHASKAQADGEEEPATILSGFARYHCTPNVRREHTGRDYDILGHGTRIIFKE